jgi:hypothetical protein
MWSSTPLPHVCSWRNYLIKQRENFIILLDWNIIIIIIIVKDVFKLELSVSAIIYTSRSSSKH